jgi:hypothetical protein
MTSRKEDELDLTAMSIAHQIKRSDNLRVPRNPEKAGEVLMRHVEAITRRVRKDGAA